MRFGRLDLIRYGRFTDASLAFGPAGVGKPDLHIVYGDNEAGKTTTLNAMLDLVFGIEAATPYRFLHQAAALRLGGELEFGGAPRNVIRLPKAPLLDAEERPLPEGLFNQDIAGLDRAVYQTMFSLDEKTLSAGGESILASRGDLGQLLFSATAGLADFGDALAKVRVETETFYKVHGRKHDLGDLKRRLADLKERRTAIDITATPFTKMLLAREDAEAAYAAAVGERGRLQAALAAVRRQLAVLPQATEWTHLKSEHDALRAGPDVPQGWPEALAELQTSMIALGTRRAASFEEIERLSKAIETLPHDDAALALATRVRGLAGLKSRDATAAKDLPDRRAALRLAETRIGELLGDLGEADRTAPRQLLLPNGLVNRLRQSLETLSGLAAARHEALAELAEAEGRLEGASAEFDEARVTTVDATALAYLKGALEAADANDSLARVRLAERAVTMHGQALADRLARLAPWQGDAEALLSLDVPAQHERERLEQSLASAQRRRDHWQAESERLGDEIDRTKCIRDGLVAERSLVDDLAARESRSARDTAWSLHIERLGLDSARAFEQALRADDMTASARFAQAADLSELRSLNRTLDATSADFARARQKLDGARNELQVLETEIAARLSAFVGLDCGTPLAAFEGFLALRDRALDARQLLRVAEADRASAEQAAAETRARLAEALDAVGAPLAPDASLGAALAAGRAALERLHAGFLLHERLTGLAREVDERRRQVERAERGNTLWQDTWQQLLQGTWLAGAEVGRVRDALAVLGDLAAALEFRDGLADRVAKMDADRAAFAIEITEVASALGIVRDADVGVIAERIEARARDASTTAAARAAKIEDRARAQDRLADLQPALDAAEARAEQMRAVFAVATLDELSVALGAARRREDLAARLGRLEIEIRGACATETVEAALVQLGALDRSELERRHGELETLSEDQVTYAQERFAALGRARDAVAAVDGDATAARLEAERRTILVEIEERTMAHLALRAGMIAAEGAISLYRERHRSSMMRRASVLFSHLTRGVYSGVAAQNAKDGEVLVGLVAGGGSKLSTELSTATRHQLYLALRIAAYHEFTRSRRPLPFVLDDVLETFDDDRAEASLTQLAEMATTGQVIYLTHHKHLCAIARRVCPEAKFHDLGGL